MAAADFSCRVHSVWLRKPVGDAEGNEKASEQPVHFVRHRAEVRTHVDFIGLDDSHEHHRYRSAQVNWKDASERTVLVNCVRHYVDLAKKFPENFSIWDPEAKDYDVEGKRHCENIIGEQLLVDGDIDAENVCVGDLLGTDQSNLVLQVRFPRLPCFRVDHRYPVGPPQLYSGQPGTVRQWIATNSRGGFFCSVKNPGDVAAGDKLRLLQRPHPTWTVSRLSALCYPKTPLHVTWSGTDAELQELCEMEALGYHEWRERLIVARATLAAERPLQLASSLGQAVTRQEGMEAIRGSWYIEGCAGLGLCVDLEFDGMEVRSTQPLFGGTYLIAKPHGREAEFTLDVQMGHFPMVATMNKQHGKIILVFSSGSLWTKVY